MKPARTRRRTSRRRESSRRWQSLLLVAVIGLLVVGVGGTLGTIGVVGYYSQGLPSIDGLSAGNLAQSTRIYDRNGTLIRELSHENRTVVPLGRISMQLQNATISVEDRTFYSNPGVDYRRVLIAAAYDATHRSAALGGSTITQQVVKNSVLADTQGRHIAQGIERQIVVAVRQNLGLAHHLEPGVEAQLVEADARGERAGERSEIEFHGILRSGDLGG